MNPHVDYLLRLGDSSLVLGQRLAEWCGHGPVLEEDIAMANVSLDLIGQARLLLSHAGRIEGTERGEGARAYLRGEGALAYLRDEDALAYLRDARAYRNFTLCELPNSGIEKGGAHGADYAITMLRNLLYCAYQVQLWESLRESTDSELAAIAAKSAKESAYHLRHAADWTVRFGDGTGESHARAQRALDQLWPYTNELFVTDAVEEEVAAQGIGVRGAELHPAWDAMIDATLAEACLIKPAASAFCSTGKTGLHSEHLDFLLAEMQVLARQHPGAQW